MDLISVIVPIYNVEKYMDMCIQSIVEQSYVNLEIILVDDGSTDSCPTMCDAWAERDSRIKVVHKENGGSALARNVGLDIAKGDYIAFVDSDDMMNRDMITILYNTAVEQNADIVECDYSIEENEVLNQTLHTISIDIYDSQRAMLGHIRDKVFRQVIWNKLYRTRSIDKIRFVEGKVIDDEFWTYRVIGNATKLARIEKKLYFYRQQDESVMHQRYSLTRLVSVEAHIERHKFISTKFPVLYEQSLIRLWFDCRYHGQMSLLNLRDADKEKAFDYLQNIIQSFPLPYRYIWHQGPTEIVWLLVQKLSFKVACKLRNIFRKGL